MLVLRLGGSSCLPSIGVPRAREGQGLMGQTIGRTKIETDVFVLRLCPQDKSGAVVRAKGCQVWTARGQQA